MAAKKDQNDALARSIASRERGINAMLLGKKRIMEQANKECADIDKRLAEKRLLLDALKRGAIKA